MSRYVDTEKVDDVIQTELGVYDTTDLKEMLKYFPREDVAPVVHAKWIIGRYCSNCEFDNYRIAGETTKYCPDCGAKMDKE